MKRMGRLPGFEKGLKKGPWTSEEDQKLVTYIQEHGHGSWHMLPLKAGLQRCGKSCRLRWTNYLRPDIKRGKFSLQEEQTIMQLHALLGNRWSTIATQLPGRTDNEIKNYWNTHLKKRLTKMGIDPITHKSRTTTTTNLSHMTQWENARLEAEARLVRESRLVSNFYKQIKYGSTSLINKLPMSPLLQPQPLCLDVLKGWQDIISRKSSNLSGPKPLVSTLNISETLLPSLPNTHSQSMSSMIENTEPSSQKDMTTKHCNNEWEIAKGLVNILESSNDEVTQNVLEVNDMIYQDDYLMEALTNDLVNDASNETFDGDCKDDNGYWSNILDKLGNNMPFSPIF